MNKKLEKYISSLEGIDKIEFENITNSMVCDTDDKSKSYTFYYYEQDDEFVLALVQLIDYKKNEILFCPYSKISDELEDIFHGLNKTIEAKHKKVTVYYDENKTIH